MKNKAYLFIPSILKMTDIVLHLVSKEGTIIDAPIEPMKASILIEKMLDGGEDDDDKTIPLPNVSSHILRLIVDFLKYYYTDKMDNIPKPIPSVDLEDFITKEWYANFVNKMSNMEIFELISAANYMDIEPIISLGCAKIASMIKGKTSEEIRNIFNVEES